MSKRGAKRDLQESLSLRYYTFLKTDANPGLALSCHEQAGPENQTATQNGTA